MTVPVHSRVLFSKAQVPSLSPHCLVDALDTLMNLNLAGGRG